MAIRTRAGPLPVALAGLVAGLVFVTWGVVAGGAIPALDWSVHRLADSHQPEGWAMNLHVAVARIGQRWLTVPLLLAAGCWAARRHRSLRPLLAVVVGLGTLATVGMALKVGIGRTPPIAGYDGTALGVGNITAWLADLLLGTEGFTGFVSYPSGHAANAMLSYPLLGWLLFGGNGGWPHVRALRRALWGATVPAVAVGAMMVALDYHWLSDTVGGWLLGGTIALLSRMVLGPAGGGGDSGESARGSPANTRDGSAMAAVSRGRGSG